MGAGSRGDIASNLLLNHAPFVKNAREARGVNRELAQGIVADMAMVQSKLKAAAEASRLAGMGRVAREALEKNGGAAAGGGSSA